MYAAEGGHQEVCAWLAGRGVNPTATGGVNWFTQRLAACFDPIVSVLLTCFCCDQQGRRTDHRLDPNRTDQVSWPNDLLIISML